MALKGFRIQAAPSRTNWQSDNLHNVRYDAERLSNVAARVENCADR